MATHARKIVSNTADSRVQFKFERADLLWIGETTHPKTAETYTLPLVITDGAVVGPTILDMLHRQVRTSRDDKDDGEVEVGYWCIRDPRTVFPAPTEQRQRRGKPRNIGDRKKFWLDHPFRTDLTSGGWPDRSVSAPDGFLRVRKFTTITIAEYACRLAAHAFGGSDAAADRFIRAGKACWEADLVNSNHLWQIVRGHPDRWVLETPEIEALRPRLSISQEVERIVTRDAFMALGMDPDMDLSRRPGGRRAPVGEDGNIISLKLVDDGETVIGKFKAEYQSIAADTPLSDVPMDTLVGILGSFRLDGFDADADLLEAFLDATAPDWREAAAANAAAPEADGPGNADPFEILGVPRTATLEEVRKAKLALLKRLHPDSDVSKESSWRPSSFFAAMINDAYSKIEAERKGVQ